MKDRKLKTSIGVPADAVEMTWRFRTIVQHPEMFSPKIIQALKPYATSRPLPIPKQLKIEASAVRRQIHRQASKRPGRDLPLYFDSSDVIVLRLIAYYRYLIERDSTKILRGIYRRHVEKLNELGDDGLEILSGFSSVILEGRIEKLLPESLVSNRGVVDYFKSFLNDLYVFEATRTRAKIAFWEILAVFEPETYFRKLVEITPRYVNSKIVGLWLENLQQESARATRSKADNARRALKDFSKALMTPVETDVTAGLWSAYLSYSITHKAITFFQAQRRRDVAPSEVEAVGVPAEWAIKLAAIINSGAQTHPRNQVMDLIREVPLEEWNADGGVRLQGNLFDELITEFNKIAKRLNSSALPPARKAILLIDPAHDVRNATRIKKHLRPFSIFDDHFALVTFPPESEDLG